MAPGYYIGMMRFAPSSLTWRIVLLAAVLSFPLGSQLFAGKTSGKESLLSSSLAALKLDQSTDIQPGRIYHIRVDLRPDEIEFARRDGGNAPHFAIVSVGVPDDFDPAKNYNILYTSVTGDLYATNAWSIGQYYEPCRQAGWVVLSADGDFWPEKDTISWRLTGMSAALRATKKWWPHSRRWDFYSGGYSGGSKLSFYTLAFAKLLDRPAKGLFLGGCNESKLLPALRYCGIEDRFYTDLKVFHSIGKKDRIAPERRAKKVRKSLHKLGINHQKTAYHDGGHKLISGHIKDALDYFSKEEIN